MRTQLRLASILLLSLTAAPAALAQDAGQDTPDKSIIVTGKALPPVKRAERFVHQVVSTSEGQLARFIEPMCPQVLGVPQNSAAAVEDRLRRVATDAGVPVAPDKCEPNLMVLLVRDADSFVKLMRKRHSSFFADLSDVDLRDAFRSGPVHSWRLIETRDEDGHVAGSMVETHSSSVFSPQTQSATVNSVIVIDKHVAQGKTVSQISDYVAMRTLAGARPPRKGPIAAETILTLFDPNTTSAPAGLTTMDKGLLAGLYGAEGNADAMAQAHQISRRMATGAKAPAAR